jgi:hypothetical protein
MYARSSAAGTHTAPNQKRRPAAPIPGVGPVEMEVGRRRLASYEAASAWRREREALNY